MSGKCFRSTTHVIPGQQITEYPNSTATSSEDVLKLEVKQYIPRDNPNPQFGDITIIAAHTNGFPKGLVINEGNIDNEFLWFDRSRDLLRTVDIFRGEMPLPLFSIGHSMGAAQLGGLASMHPRLFTNLILLDHITPVPTRNLDQLMKVTSLQPDLWSFREEAEAAPRYRDTPTIMYSEAGKVTKRTINHQEFFSAWRPNFGNVAMERRPATAEENRTHPDVDGSAPIQSPFYTSSMREAFV
ncbi:hypothetical protein BDZ45DRAFT_755884 [Acephala macrosclerotiorum]|nr:hypothetical protein BDZ45DRAFT_755884 [Acephala macrosclerotiorum]